MYVRGFIVLAFIKGILDVYTREMLHNCNVRQGCGQCVIPPLFSLHDPLALASSSDEKTFMGQVIPLHELYPTKGRIVSFR
jgi:hypothetical protein